jgi:hypothetical protein
MFSQSGADGIIGEFFHRIGTTNCFFVEFGVGNGLENNTVARLLHGWTGLWVEGSKANNKRIQKAFKPFIDTGQLTVAAQFLDRDNIGPLFAACNVPCEPELLSIDVDGNDYWFWEALEQYTPRVVVIEYNAMLGPTLPWVMAYNAKHRREALVVSSYKGASLKALEKLGTRKGYSLVGCDFLGVNAFFVRNDLVGDKFFCPYTSENHFEPHRLFLYRRNGQPRRIGPFVRPDYAQQEETCNITPWEQ